MASRPNYSEDINIMWREMKAMKRDNKELQKEVSRLQRECTESTITVERLEDKIDNMESGASAPTKLTDMIPMDIVQDVFDVDHKELDKFYTEKTWSDLGEDLKSRMIRTLTNGLIAGDYQVPHEKHLKKRLKGFYSSRRNVRLLNKSPTKKRKRKLALKANRLTYVARKKAVSTAVQKGLDEEEVRAVRDRVPKVSVENVSPIISSDDEEGQEELKRKRSRILSKARYVKSKKRQEEVRHDIGIQSYIARREALADEDVILVPESETDDEM